MSASETDYLTHDHYFLSRSHDDSARRTLWVVGLTAVMMVGEIIAGLVYGSMALLADGFHMATHAGALAVAAGAYAYACPSSKHLAQVWRGVNGERASSGVGF